MQKCEQCGKPASVLYTYSDRSVCGACELSALEHMVSVYGEGEPYEEAQPATDRVMSPNFMQGVPRD